MATHSESCRISFLALLTVALFGQHIRPAEPPVKLPQQPNRPLYPKYSPDGKWLVIAQNGHQHERCIQLWDVSAGKLVHTLLAGDRHAGGGIFTPDGKELICQGLDPSVKVVDLTTFKERILIHLYEVGHMAVTPDGKTLVVSGRQQAAMFYNLRNGQPDGRIRDAPGDTKCVAVSPDGKLLATGHRDGSVILWDMATKKRKDGFNVERSVSTLTFSPDGKTLGVGVSGGLLVLWDVNRSEVILRKKPDAELQSIDGLAFLPDGKRLVVAGYGPANLLLWDGEKWSGIPDKGEEGHGKNEHIRYMALSPDGKTVATASMNDKRVILWKIPPPEKRN